MHTKVLKRGLTVIPEPIRKKYNIRAGDRLLWMDDRETIKVTPLTTDPIKALRGIGRGEGLMENYWQFAAKNTNN
jgi:bifunctional DNA-binding transcriptional regulator/antitoxin component of YhaV-PrlF toxin-antitoxin module